MPSYRFYVLDESDHFIHAVEEDAMDDESAERRGERLATGNPVEIWSGARKVARLDAVRAVKPA